jgi:predicted MPP superfamily phosphohydrolase
VSVSEQTPVAPAQEPQDTAGPPVRRGGRWRFLAFLCTALLLLFGVPWASFALAGWPGPVVVTAAVICAAALVAFPVLMYQGHSRHGRDWAARVADTMLGVVWVLFTWSLLGDAAHALLALAGVAGAGRLASVGTLVVSAVLIPWGAWEALRVPRVRAVEVRLPRLGVGLDGLRLVLLTDTHYGPINRERWSRRVAEVVNSLAPDVVAHTGDIADGSPAKRRAQAAPLGTLRAPLGKVYITGNHEYFGDAQGWLDHMAQLGWEPLHNRHVVVERGGDRLVLAGVDDRTAAGSGAPGHGADLAAALAGTDPQLPVVLLAHQPQQVPAAVAAGVDLQLSGHTHGGQIWPFHYLVRTDQPALQGLARFSERTQLYTSRGTGFWGPPLRIFAPSEITLLTLRPAAG